jgi:hypothetical protein
MTQVRGIGKRERVTREILRHVDGIVVDKDFDVRAMSTELQDFLRPLTLKQVKAVVLAAAKSDAAFWDKFGGALELMLIEDTGRVADGGDKDGLQALVGEALVAARRDLDTKLSNGLRVLRSAS